MPEYHFASMQALFDQESTWLPKIEVRSDHNEEVLEVVNESMIVQLSDDTVQLNVIGAIIPKFSWMESYMPGRVTSMESLTVAISEIKRNRDIKKVLLYVSSSGGNALGIAGVWSALRDLVKVMDVAVAYTQDMALSAGYWIASSMPLIYADRYASVGSIGGYSIAASYSDMFKDQGVEHYVARTGAKKGVPSSYEPLTSFGKKVLDEWVADTTKAFFDQVKMGRAELNLDSDWNTGESFLGTVGKRIGLVDKVMPYVQLVKELT